MKRFKYFVIPVANGWVVWKGDQPDLMTDQNYARLHVFTSRKSLLGYLNTQLKEDAKPTPTLYRSVENA